MLILDTFRHAECNCSNENERTSKLKKFSSETHKKPRRRLDKQVEATGFPISTTFLCVRQS